MKMCPTGVDQTTRSAQRWQVLAPEKRQVLPSQEDYFVTTDFSIKYDAQSEKTLQERVWDMLARPAQSIPLGSGLPPLSNEIHSSSGHFSLLSNEIFDMVFSHLESRSDIIALGLTSTSLWRRVLHHIQSGYIAAAAPWANARLIFQGSYSEDLPKALTDDGDLVKNLVRPSPFRRGYERRADARVFYHAVAGTVRPETVREAMRGYVDAMKVHQRGSGVGIGKREWEVLKRDVRGPERERGEREWVLRNLTTAEVVFSGVVGRMDRKASLEVILVQEITWTSMLGRRVEDMERWRGKWAGHRFDIVTREVHEKEGGEWVDVSVAMVQSLKEL